MGIKIFLCASTYPERETTVRMFGIDVSNCITGFMNGNSPEYIPSFLKSYRMMLYSYLGIRRLLKVHRPTFLVVTGVPTRIPRSMAEKTIAYIHFPVGLFMASQEELNSRLRIVMRNSWKFISNISRVTLLTNSNYEKNLIRRVWGQDATVIHPPCPQYDFPLSDNREDVVCSLARFSPEKGYDMVLEIARRLPDIQFELIGTVSSDMSSYCNKLIKESPKNVRFHINVTMEEKIEILKKSKALLHSFMGEHFGIAIVEAMSAGIIPVTHDSGAAKEDGIVPDRFRYNNFNEAVNSVSDAVSIWNTHKACELRQAAAAFSPDSFNQKMKSFISNWIRANNLDRNHSQYK